MWFSPFDPGLSDKPKMCRPHITPRSSYLLMSHVSSTFLFLDGENRGISSMASIDFETKVEKQGLRTVFSCSIRLSRASMPVHLIYPAHTPLPPSLPGRPGLITEKQPALLSLSPLPSCPSRVSLFFCSPNILTQSLCLSHWVKLLIYKSISPTKLNFFRTEILFHVFIPAPHT